MTAPSLPSCAGNACPGNFVNHWWACTAPTLVVNDDNVNIGAEV